MHHHRRFLAAPLAMLAATALAALAAVPNAGASPPIQIPPNPDVTWPAGTVCPYPVRVENVANGSLLHTLRNGQLLITGRLVDRVINKRTGASKIYVVNGPLRIIPHADGSATLISHGRILWTLFATDAGGPGLFIYTGRAVLEVSADGTGTSTSRIPRVEDICAELG